MRIGVYIFCNDKGIQPAELGVELEQRGFDSVWLPEHSHIPVARETPYGGRSDQGEMPEEYSRTHDQFVALAVIAATTKTLRISTGITLVAQHDALWLAKQVASLDVVSNGRVNFGVGYGWNHEEMASHSVEIGRRRAVVREKVLACVELWTKDVAEFDGEFVRFPPSWSWPKPVQKPHPPIFIGAPASPVHSRHIVEFADGWMPAERWFDMADQWQRLRGFAADQGRDPASIQLNVITSYAQQGETDTRHLDGLQELGASVVILLCPALDRDAALRMIESYQPLIDRYHC